MEQRNGEAPRRIRTTRPSGVGASFFFAPVLDGTAYSPTAERRAEVLGELRDNLEGLADLARNEGIRLILCTVPSNVVDWPPDPDPSTPPQRDMRNSWLRIVQ